ncbi:hypothetical protein [Clostridium fallax]|uniref:Uncharacterized protein n=1 Tax=Clostridium fallax TaxID=1533 RepID=A0A1M4TUF8_9CLOT|nr:hypothetical protein [Clostridium fallax]SHE48119.1 hypothetical protein SAMN05443638_103128 [Clostridium fallax]SQB22388.1 Uncharacterised protein [Clostridium fallax]
MKENLINYFKKYPLWIIAILTFIIPIYLFSNGRLNKDFQNAKKVSKNINSINDNLKLAIKNSSLDTSVAVSILSDNINNLSSLKNNLKNLKISDKYKDVFNSLDASLDSNLRLCNQTSLLLQNPSSNDIEVSLDSLYSLLDETNKNYLYCSKYGLNPSLTSSGEDFYNAVQTYINEIIKINRDSKINSSKNNEFIRSLDDSISKLNPIIEDLIPAIEKVREDKRDIGVIIDNVKEKKSSLNLLINDFNSMSVPSQGMECFEKFQIVLDNAKVYLDSLMESLKEEEAFNKIDYSNVNTDYEKTNSSLDSFKTFYNEFINSQ